MNATEPTIDFTFEMEDNSKPGFLDCLNNNTV